jgi:hypothetical protein
VAWRCAPPIGVSGRRCGHPFGDTGRRSDRGRWRLPVGAGQRAESAENPTWTGVDVEFLAFPDEREQATFCRLPVQPNNPTFRVTRIRISEAPDL